MLTPPSSTSRRICSLLLMAFMLVELLWSEVEAFGLHRQQLLARTETCLSAEVSNSPKVTEDGPAGIGGAEFFGGNKEKEEFYNEEEEQSATISIAPETIDTSLSQTSSERSPAASDWVVEGNYIHDFDGYDDDDHY